MAKGISLHIGLNAVSAAAYGGWSGKLNACEADANDMEALAKSKGFKTTKLLTKAGTRKRVLAAVKSAATALSSGDIFFLTYSGHGGQLPDMNGDEVDNQDETWCLYDGELVDDDLNLALCGFKPGVRVLVLSDSCHSGTSTRAIERKAHGATFDATAQVLRDANGVAIRMMPPAYLLGAYYAQKKTYDKVLKRPAPPAPKASVLLISGCQDDQTSADGDFNGLFTGTLKSVWANGGFAGAYKAFHKAIVAKMPASQKPALFPTGAANSTFIAQTPFTV
jgi:hypothetical protein